MEFLKEKLKINRWAKTKQKSVDSQIKAHKHIDVEQKIGSEEMLNI